MITFGCIGYLVAGFSGAPVVALARFLPRYVLTIVPAPYFKKYGKNPALNAFVNGVTAAATGAIAGAVAVLGKHSLVDLTTWIIAVVTLLVLIKSKIPEPLLILAAALVGVWIKLSMV